MVTFHEAKPKHGPLAALANLTCSVRNQEVQMLFGVRLLWVRRD